jgi:hypothetical protein
MHDVYLWANNLIWTENADSVKIAQEYLEKAIAIAR